MKLTALARGARGERGLTLTELLVTTTIIAVLAAVIATGVGGSVTTGNESSRSQLFDAVQKAVDGYASSHLPADGELTKAEYPFARAGAPFPGTTAANTTAAGAGSGGSTATATVVFRTNAKPDKNDPADERVGRDWYGADGKFLFPQPGSDPASASGALFGPTLSTFVYVDLYSGGADCRISTTATSDDDKGSYATSGGTFLKTDLRCLGSVALPASASKSFGTPGTSGQVIRCIFASNIDTITVTDQKTGKSIITFSSKGESEPATAKAAVGANRGKVLACRDADPAGTSK